MSEDHTEQGTYPIDERLRPQQQNISFMMEDFLRLLQKSTSADSAEEAERIVFAKEFADYVLNNWKNEAIWRCRPDATGGNAQ